MKLSSDGTIKTLIHNDYEKGKKNSIEESKENINEKNNTVSKDQTSKTHKDVISTEVITYTINRVAKTGMLEDEEKVVQQGVKGSIQIVTRVYYTNNVETGREQLSNIVPKVQWNIS